MPLQQETRWHMSLLAWRPGKTIDHIQCNHEKGVLQSLPHHTIKWGTYTQVLLIRDPGSWNKPRAEYSSETRNHKW